MSTKITEEDKETLEGWKAEARNIKTTEELTAFINKLTSDYQHDYGTIIHAMFYAMQAAMRVVDRSPQGGITGFQAGCLGWMMVQEYLSHGQDGPMRLQQFNDMLYPQNKERFECSMSEDTWKWLQEEAAKKLNERSSVGANSAVSDHWKSIVDGQIPFGWSVEK